MQASRFEKARANSKPLLGFIAKPEVAEWLEIEVRGKETKRTYTSSLFRYWNGCLGKKYSSLNAWIDAVNDN